MKHSNRDKHASSPAKSKSAVPPTLQPSKQDANDPRRAADGKNAPSTDGNKPGVIVASSANKQNSSSAQK